MSVLERVLVAGRRVSETVLRPLARESERATGACIASSPSETATGEAAGRRITVGSKAMAASAAVVVDGRGRHSTRPTARYQIFATFLPLSLLFHRILPKQRPARLALLPIKGFPWLYVRSFVPGCTRPSSTSPSSHRIISPWVRCWTVRRCHTCHIQSLILLVPDIPSGPGYLPKWQLFVAATALFNTVQNFMTIKLTSKIYNTVPPNAPGKLHRLSRARCRC